MPRVRRPIQEIERIVCTTCTRGMAHFGNSIKTLVNETQHEEELGILLVESKEGNALEMIYAPYTANNPYSIYVC